MQRWRDRQHKVEPDHSPSRRLDTRSNSTPNWDAWNEWADAKIANALAVERKAIVELLASEMSKALDDAYNDLAEEARSLRIEVTALQDTVEQLRSIIKSEKAKVIDLPNLLRRAK
jgi:uncharacterized protein YlxW (UPF0749 family)